MTYCYISTQVTEGTSVFNLLIFDVNVSVFDVKEDGPQSRGVSADFITFWSTVPGYASFRHEIEG